MRVLALMAMVALSVGAMGMPTDKYVPSFYVVGMAKGLQDESTAVRTASQVRGDWRDMVDELIKIAKQKPSEHPLGPDWDPKCLAIGLLGDMRAEAAVGPLMGELGYSVVATVGGYHRMSYGPTHPAAEALAKIGNPASKKALLLLHETTDPERTRALVWVIAQVEGADLTKYLISQQQERYTLPPDSGNLARALGLVDEMVGK
jgi:hypothetical protein